jgi:hypothetical protein
VGSIPSRGRDFVVSSSPRPDRLWGAHATSYPVGTEVVSLQVKRPGREAGHSPPPSAEIKNAWSITSVPSYVLLLWYLVKHRESLPFTPS